MGKNGLHINAITEQAIQSLLQSQAQTRIYLYLLRKDKARSEDIVRGTRLHPSTVRELLSKMYTQNRIRREKLKNGCIGKNPYVYCAVPPKKLLQKYIEELEKTFNSIIHLPNQSPDSTHQIRITIDEKTEET